MNARLGQILLAVTLLMTTAEFMDVQSLSVDDLRTRFGLAPSCQPSVTASSTDQMINQVAVAIECRAEPSAPSPGRAAGEHRAPSLPGKPGQ
ncbi:MAG: hypothetical protein AUH20_06535 [Candidatus Rokubacteria bacterium 13_2_20CM_69_15_2]|nr:MAG: hypothetical protein AUH20_06535 [Candidatus Rokubacteria bacterium 13_2_20CM_69_15_2]PYO21500.1 MAG: hypothetical protein DMD88_09120 [Candidatus Rokubacteria bacterium]